MLELTNPSSSPTTPAPAVDSTGDAALREALKRCSPATIDAACAFRRTGDASQLPILVRGVVERFVDRELRAKLNEPPETLRLAEDLQLDSLTMMEIVMLAEEALPISISNDELRNVRTLADIEHFIVRKVREPAPTATPAQPAMLAAAQPEPSQ
jgi:acyl carrier protein